MEIRAAIFRECHAPFSVERVRLDAPRAGEVLVRMLAAGVCHSDWHLITGATMHPAPCVAGHEGAGVVEAVGPDTRGVKVGDLVSLNWAPYCGRCFYCQAGRPALCKEYLMPIWAGTMLDGTTRLSQDGQPVYHFSALACFAEYAVVPEQCCVTMPQGVPGEVAALIGCAVTTGVGAVLNTAQVEPGSTVVVFGAGGVGLSMVLGARLAGARQVIVIDVTERKLEVARSLGADVAMLDGQDALFAIRELTEGRGADFVFEAAGVPSAQQRCLDAVRTGGTVVFAGLTPMDSETSLSGAAITRREITIKGSYYGTCVPHRDFVRYAELYLAGELPLDRLISRRYELSEINEAYADMLSGVGARGVLTFQND